MAIAFIGCEKEEIENGCTCNRDVYEREVYFTYPCDGCPGNMHTRNVYLYSNLVECQPESEQFISMGADHLYYKITCD